MAFYCRSESLAKTKHNVNANILPCHGFSQRFIVCAVEQIKTILRRTKKTCHGFQATNSQPAIKWKPHRFCFHFILVRAHMPLPLYCRCAVAAAAACVFVIYVYSFSGNTLSCHRTIVVIVTFHVHSEYIFLELDSVVFFSRLFILLFYLYILSISPRCEFMQVKCFKVGLLVIVGVVANHARVRFRQWRSESITTSHMLSALGTRRDTSSTRHVSFFHFGFHPIVGCTRSALGALCKMHCSPFN